MSNDKSAEEIVRGLRNCKAYKTKSDLQTTMLMAADCIEALQAQLAEMRKDCDIIDAANTALHGALETSQQRERAAVEDLKDALYDPLAIDCEYCKYRGAETDEHVATTGGCHACENHGGFYNCFEWRGPQQAGEG